MVYLPDEAPPLPRVEEIEFDGTVSTSLDAILPKIKSIPYYSITFDGSEITLVNVESRNINKKPYLFYIIKISQDKLKITFSVPQDTSENLRKATVIKNTASLLSMIYSDFRIQEGTFFQYVDSVIDNMISSLSQSYSSIFNKYDALLSEYKEIKRLNIELSASNRNLTIQSAALNEENKALKDQLSSLKKYSDESLMASIQDWIQVHGSSIDINEFSKAYTVPPSRVEQILDKMVSMGYLELKS